MNVLFVQHVYVHLSAHVTVCMLAAPVWMAQFRKSGASFSTSQPCRAACIHGIWNILFSCRQRTCKTCHKPRHTQNALHLCTQSHLHGKINTSQTIESCSRQVKTMLQKDKFKQPQSQYLVDPFEPRYFTRVYLLFQPWSHTHSLHRHAGLEKERESQREIWNVSKFDSNLSSFNRLFILL